LAGRNDHDANHHENFLTDMTTDDNNSFSRNQKGHDKDVGKDSRLLGAVKKSL
jgi:hypothetical protein